MPTENFLVLIVLKLTFMRNISSAIFLDVSFSLFLHLNEPNVGADTGDRPYMCVLCRDTFSRSDILKRHFQKCSIRRGNPTGASHLSHAQAHLKKSHPGPHKPT